MAFQALQFKAGINREITPYSNENGYVDGDKIRFRFGYPEKMGGWERYTKSAFLGSSRNIHNWIALDSSDYMGLGTTVKYYIEEGTEFNDITPERLTINSSIQFTTTNGSNIVTFSSSTSHEAGIGDFVTISSADAAVQGIPASDFNKEFKIISIVDSTKFTIQVSTNASGSGTGTAMSSGSVTAKFQIGIGLDDVVGGKGWGAGTWGGTDDDVAITTLNGAINNSTTTVAVTSSNPGHQMVTNDVILIDDELMIITNVSTNNLTVVRAYAGSGANTNVNTAGHGGTDSFNTITSNVGTDAVAHSDGASVRLVTGNSSAEDDFIGWGQEARVTVTTQIRLWSHDNFGEDLLINVRDSNIFYWDKTQDVTTRAIELKDRTGTKRSVPQIAKQILVSDVDRHVIAFGCDGLGGSTDPEGDGVQDPLLIRFSSQENPIDWFPTDTNTAGDLRIGSGSEFVQAVETKREILVFTDKSLHSMTFIGAPFTFGISQLASNITIMSPRSASATEDVVFWMGIDNFYTHAGQTKQLPCTVKDKVFLDFNLDQRDKVISGVNSEFSEVFWFYPSSGSQENNKYVVYNYGDNLWYYGTLERTAWLDRGTRTFPMAVGPKVLNISSITQANPAVVTITEAHNLTTGDQVSISGVLGMTGINDDVYTITSISATTFSLDSTNSTGFNAYTSGGKAKVIGSSYLYNHETGFDDDGVAMTSFIESSPMDMGSGDKFVFIKQVIPDITFNGTSSFGTPRVNFTVKAKNYPGGTFLQSENPSVERSATVPIEQFTNKLDYRIRGRSFAFRVDSDTIGCKYKLGTPRVDMREDGRR